jgi:hypothetical protein
MRKLSILPALAAVLAGAAPASADIQPGNIRADSIQAAYATQPNTTYTGAFQPDTATYHDLDYLALTVQNPGETVEFTLQNTSLCTPPGNYEYCPVYLSLLNQSNTLIADGAGTIATYNDTEWFDWTFQTPGTYYMVMESNGDEPAGNPTYAVSYKVVSQGSQSSGAPGGNPGSNPNPNHGQPAKAPLVRSLRVASKQHGRTVRALLRLGRRGSVHATLRLRGSPRSIVTLRRGSLGPGSHRLSLRMPASYQKALTYGLLVNLRISVRGRSGPSRTFSEDLLVTG